jgi:UDP-N-acetylglucosamine acyltransferase
MTSIHPTAIVHPSAEIAADAVIGAYTTVEAEVRVGAGCRIGSYVTLGERLRLGREVRVFNYAYLGGESQDKKHRGEQSHAEIGDRTVVREFVTVNRATREGGVTRVGADCLLMAYSHVAHECEIGDGVVLVNGATIGGEVVVEEHAIISGLACVHQFCRIGRHVIVGAGSKVTLDIPPYLLADGHPARTYGPNVVGLRRHGFAEARILTIRRIYRELFRTDRMFAESLERVANEFAEAPEIEAIVAFCRGSQRGIARPRLRPGRGAPDGATSEPEFDEMMMEA